MLCPSCHTPNRDNAKFCKKCGLPFVPEIGDSAPVKAQEDVVVPSAAASTSTESSSAPAPSGAPVPAEGVDKAAETPEQSVVSASDASTQDAAVDQTASPAASSPVAEVKGEDDIALAPTQILSPDKMVELQTRRWQHDIEREHQQPAKDVAEMPTMMMQPVGSNLFTDATILPITPAPRPPDMSAQPDIAEMPTVLITPGEIAPPPPASDSPAQGEDETVLPKSEGQPSGTGEVKAGETQEAQKTTQTTETAGPSSGAAPSPSQEEDGMEHVSSTNNQPPQDSQSSAEQQTPPTTAPEQSAAAEDFTLLESGTLLEGRYEVAQVISEDPTEHVYSVIDKQGYQHCWNCGSEENAEGDEFCITCGAELLNASYTMHEYPASASGDSESHVLHGTIVNTFVDSGRTYVIEQAQAMQTSSPNGVRLVAASDSDAGDVRRSEVNEDSTLVLQLQRVHESIAYPSGVFIVADGMGGHDAGQLASHMAIGTIAERMVRELVAPPLETEKAGGDVPEQTEDTLVELLHGAVEDANTAICQKNQQAGTDMGSTITGFMIVGDLAYIFNVGDSRTYMQRDGKLYQLTNDHSLVGQLVAGGLIEPDDVYTHPQRSQIYRSLGDKLNVQIDIFKQQVTPGDILLSCSDGLWEMVRNPQITDILNNAPDPHTACTRLIEAANANGGEDNVSAVVVFVR
jgi:serine/threonine protein phosphatase PrpC